MHILQSGIANTIDYYRDDPAITLDKVEIINADTAAILATVAAPTNDTTDTAIVAAIGYKETTFKCANLVHGRNYKISHDPVSKGPSQKVKIIAVNIDGSDLNMIYREFTADMLAGCKCKGILSSFAYTPPTTLTNVELIFLMYFSDNSVKRDQGLIVKYRVDCPVRSEDVIAKWPRLSNTIPTDQAGAQEGYAPQIALAWSRLRSDLYANQIILDRIVDVHALKGVLFSYIERELLEAGTDTSAKSDRAMAIKDIISKCARELRAALKLKLFIDNEDDNDNGGQTKSRVMNMGIFNDSYQDNWRY